VFLVVFGRGRLQAPARGVDAVLRFLRERVLPQDVVAVLAYDRATDFTTDHARIARVVERFRGGHERIEQELREHLRGLAGVYGGKFLPAGPRSRIDAVFRDDRAAPADREVPPAEVSGEARLLDDFRRATDARTGAGAAATVAVPDGGDAPFDAFVASNRQTMQDLGNLYTGIEYLRQIDGEKHLIFLTEFGLVLPRVEDDRSLAAAAADARVAITPILTGGIPDVRDPVAGAAPAPGVLARQAAMIASLQRMAELTGGQSSVNNQAWLAVDRLNSLTRHGYLLGYTPSNTVWNGAYRRIAVRVSRPEVTVLYRHGYFGRRDPLPLDRKQMVATSRMNAAAAFRRDIRDIELRARATAVREPAPARVRVDLTIAIGRLHFDDLSPDRIATFDVALLCLDGGLRIIGQAAESVRLRLDPAALSHARDHGWVYTAHLPLPTGTQSVKAVVYDYAADVLGSTVSPVR
jgi:VWFA-related protein